MACNHVKLYSYKIQNILCDSVKVFFPGYLFPQNSFNDGLERTNHIVIYLRKILFAKVYRNLKKSQNIKKLSYIWHKKKRFLENSLGEHINSSKLN